MLLLLSFWVEITKGMRIATTGVEQVSLMIVTNVDHLDCGDEDHNDEDVTDDDNNKR